MVNGLRFQSNHSSFGEEGGSVPSFSRMSALFEVFRACDMVDLGFSGPQYTWTNLRTGPTTVQERLDRAMGNRHWLNLYPDSIVLHLPSSHSDHHLVLIQGAQPAAPRQHSSPFRIQAAWFTHPQFEPFLMECWAEFGTLGLIPKLQLLRTSLQQWNRGVFGNIFDKKFYCLARLASIQRALQQKQSCRLVSLEEQLRQELDDILNQEAIYWRQKSRISWLQDGERNTRFSNMFTLLRRRRTHITRLKVNAVDWCEEPTTLKEMARDFYERLYTTEPCRPSQSSAWSFPQLTHWDRHWLNRPVSDLEIYDAVFQMGASKAPGPDGYSPVFFQRYWHILGDKVIGACLSRATDCWMSGTSSGRSPYATCW